MLRPIFVGDPPKCVTDWVMRDYTAFTVGGKDEFHLIEGQLSRETLSELGFLDLASGNWLKQPTSLRVGEAVTSLGVQAFQDCTLRNAWIPDSVATIGYNAFRSCSYLESVRLPSGLSEISHGMFNLCQRLSSVEIPKSVVNISNWAFNTCESIASITLPDSLQTIGEGAFNGCATLVELVIPASVSSISANAFSYCRSLQSVTFLGKTLEEVQELPNYPWGVPESIIRVS